MAQTSVRVRTVQDACVAVGWAGHRTLTVDRPEQAGGMGLGFNGGELLLRLGTPVLLAEAQAISVEK